MHMRKFLPVVFCGIAAISFSAFAEDSIKAETGVKATTPNASISNENRADANVGSANPNAPADANAQGSASAGASSDKPAKRDVKKQKRSKSHEGASSGSSSAESSAPADSSASKKY